MRFTMRSATRLFASSMLWVIASPPLFAAQPQAITINSQLVTFLRPLTPPSGTPAAFATVFLIAGGNGVLNLDASGDVQDLEGNFLIRSGYRFLASGLNVVMLDSAPNFPGPTGFSNQRSTQAHADLLAK